MLSWFGQVRSGLKMAAKTLVNMSQVEENNPQSLPNTKLNPSNRKRTKPRKSNNGKDKVFKQHPTKAKEDLTAQETDEKNEEEINEDETYEKSELTELELAVVAGVILEKIDNGLAKSSVSKAYSNGEDFTNFKQREDTICLELDKNVLQDFLLGLTLLEKICRSGCVKLSDSENGCQNQNIPVEKARLNLDELKTIKNWRKQTNFNHFLVKNNAEKKDNQNNLKEPTNLIADLSPNENTAEGLRYSIIDPVKQAANKENAEINKPIPLHVNDIPIKKTPEIKSTNQIKSTVKSKQNMTLKTKVLKINITKTILKNKPNTRGAPTEEPEPKKLKKDDTKNDISEEDDLQPDKAKMEIMKTNFEKEWAQIIRPPTRKDSKVKKRVRSRRKPVSRNYQRHPAEWDVICSEDGGPPFQCPVCPYQHRVKAATKRHMVIHMPDDLCTWYKCNQCDYKSKRPNSLKVHFLVHKTDDEITWYRCTICEAKFKHKTAFSQHSIRHKKKEECRLYSCDICTYSTPFRYAVARHMLTHKTFVDADQYYKCPICEYKSLNKFYLARHLKKHEKPSYKCNQCSFKTHWKSNLHSHKLSHSREDFLIECDLCDFKTLWNYSLKKHKVRRHQMKFTKEAKNKTVLYCAHCDYSTTWKRCLVSHMAMHKKIQRKNLQSTQM